MPSSLSTGVHAYLRFVLHHRRLLAFGLLTAALSGFGQTFYLGLYNAALRESFDLTHGGLGLVYGVATVVVAAVLARVATAKGL